MTCLMPTVNYWHHNGCVLIMNSTQIGIVSINIILNHNLKTVTNILEKVPLILC